MGLFDLTIFNCGNFNIFSRNRKKLIKQRLFDYSKKNDIILIPLLKEYSLDNLYPIGDEVHKWSIFIVGNDKTYILAKTTHFIEKINNDILNKKTYNGMNIKMYNFLDQIWDLTLKGTNLQLFVYTESTLFLLNSYSMLNEKGQVIGATCFMRDAGVIDKKIFDVNNEKMSGSNNKKLIN